MDNNGNWAEEEEEDEEEYEFSRNYFLAKELASSVKKSKQKITDINVVDEQVPIVNALVVLVWFPLHSLKFPLLALPWVFVCD